MPNAPTLRIIAHRAGREWIVGHSYKARIDAAASVTS
jgi:hypothetical protein